MNAKVKNLVSRANLLVDNSPTDRRGRRRYSTELRGIIHTLANECNIPLGKIAELISVSRTYVQTWAFANPSADKAPKKKNISFKKIALDTGARDMASLRRLLVVAVALSVTTTLQAMVLASLLFLGLI